MLLFLTSRSLRIFSKIVGSYRDFLLSKWAALLRNVCSELFCMRLIFSRKANGRSLDFYEIGGSFSGTREVWDLLRLKFLSTDYSLLVV